MKTNIEKEISNKGYIYYRVKGSSMIPLLRQEKDIAMIVAAPKKCKKYDVVLYKNNNKLVLHRIIKIKNNQYIIAGDNCYQKEYGITDDNIIGILHSIDRNATNKKKSRTIKVNSAKYILYSRIWCTLFPIRSLYLISRHKFAQTKLGHLIKDLIN